MKIGDYEVHPAADRFPMLPPSELAALAADIRERGLIHPIVLYQGSVLDGRNRLQACINVGVYPRFEAWDGGSPYLHVWSLNGERRDLEKDQKTAIKALLLTDDEAWQRERAEAKARANEARARATSEQPRTEDGSKLARSVATLPPTRDSKEADERKTRTALAKAAGCSPRLAQDILTIQRKAPEVLEQIAKGEVRANRYMREVRRADKMAEIATVNAPTIKSVDQRYPVILADPPWKYEHCEAENRAIENHYPTMELSDLCALVVPKAESAICFMWATSPKLDESLHVMGAWGFNYRTCAVWVKDKIGPGYYFRQRHELLLVGICGDIPTPAPSDRRDSVIEAPRGEHSVKPEVVYEMIEAMYPGLQKIELFCRNPRPGWAAWGNECICTKR